MEFNGEVHQTQRLMRTYTAVRRNFRAFVMSHTVSLQGPLVLVVLIKQLELPITSVQVRRTTRVII
jgi:hypothetical protein